MKAIFAALAALLLAVPAAAEVLAITNVTVIPMDRRGSFEDQNVIVRDGRIAAVGPAASTPVPKGATLIEGRGRFLMPGLAEMHAHVPPNPADVQWTEDVLFLYAANGITFARSMLGAPHHFALRDKAARGEIVSPRLLLSGPSLNGDSVKSPDEGARMVAEQKAAGYDFLKIHPGLDRPRYDAIAAAARRHGMPFAGHVPDAVGLARAMEAGQATVDHLDGWFAMLAPPSAGEPGFFGSAVADEVDPAAIPEAVSRARAAGLWNVPTESLIRHLLLPDPEGALEKRPEMAYVPRQMLASWIQARRGVQGQPEYDAAKARNFIALRARLIDALQEGGAGLLLGSDAPQWFNVPGFALHRELEYLVDAGLTPHEALASGTVNVARFLGAQQDFGTVAAGRRADLILLEANPLENVANVQRRAGVMLGGRWMPEERIQAGLAAIAERYKD